MFAKRKATKRFSLLLLEDEEDYVKDWVVTCSWPTDVPGNWQTSQQQLQGRLRLCTKSLFFDPDDIRVPIVRIPFASVQRLEPLDGQAFVVASTQVTQMRANLADAPYTVIKGRLTTWQLQLSYASLEDLMPLAQEQLVLAKLQGAEVALLRQAAVQAREDSAQFDVSRLVDFSERLLLECPAAQLTPLVREPGRLVVTDRRLYFQPLHNVAGDSPVRSHPLVAVAAVARRRHALQPLGIELFFLDAAAAAAAAGGGGAGSGGGSGALSGPVWDAPSAFFALRSPEERDRVAQVLAAQPLLGSAVPTSAAAGVPSLRGSLLEAAGGWLRRVTAAWQQAKISNFDYLLYLNLAAGRSFNDLAQYPVFPWVLADYSSPCLDLSSAASFRDLAKPVGALNPSRLEDFRRRFKDMPSEEEGGMPAFMYGTHYSTPGYVMYWLVRAAPAHMLRLQGGRFDAPDRLFHTMSDSWESVLSSTSDVKELIPEFYMPSQDFLVNRQQLPLGVRQTGKAVADVALPPWAHSPEHFLQLQRAALESPTVSRSLHHWVDLVFGAKQRGPAALAADNVFYHLTYEGAVDIGAVDDPVELKALVTQINEFGQTPTQLFAHPHPARLVIPPAPEPSAAFGSIASSSAAAPGPGQKAGRGGEDSGGRALTLALLSSIVAAAAPDLVVADSPAPAAAPGTVSTAPQGPTTAAASRTLPAAASAGPPPPAQAAPAAPGMPPLPPSRSPDLVAGQQQQQEEASSGGARAIGKLRSGMQRLSFNAASAVTGAASAVNEAASAVNGAVNGAVNASTGWMRRSSSGGGLLDGLRAKEKEAVLGLAAAAAAGSGEASGSEGGASVAGSEGADAAGAAAGAALPPPSPAAAGSKPLLGSLPFGFGRGGSGSSGGAAAGGSSSGGGGGFLPQLFRSSSGGSGSSAKSSSSRNEDAAAAAGAAGAGRAAKPPSPSSLLDALTGPLATTAGAAPARQAAAPAAPTAAPQLITSPRWPRGLPDSLQHQQTVQLQKVPLTSVLLGPAHGAAHAYCVGHGGLLRVLSLPLLQAYRSAKLPGDLLSLALLHGSPQQQAQQQHPLMLVGSHNRKVYAYSPDAGRLAGSFDAHEDAVSCMTWLLPSGQAQHAQQELLVTGSWDCSVKVWDVSEGRHPWAGWPVVPVAELRDLDSGVWAVAVPPAASAAAGSGGGSSLFAATEDGAVLCWDVRTGSGPSGRLCTASSALRWRADVSGDYVGGIAVSEDGNYVAVAAADGDLSLLDVRSGGARVAVAKCAAALRSCCSDGRLAVAGAEGGVVQLWDLTQIGGAGGEPAGLAAPGPDGLYPHLKCPHEGAVNGVCAAAFEGPGQERQVYLCAATEGGHLSLFGT